MLVRVYTLAYITYFGFYVSREPYSLVKSTLLATWEPFNGENGWLLLGILDTLSLTAYAIGIMVVGYLCEIYDSLHIVVAGSIGAGVTTILYGMANFWNIHNYWYFVVLRVLNGFAEAFGWPPLIKMLDHHFCNEDKRDFILTAYATCKFLGIVVGSLISSFSLSFDTWGWAFIYCGCVVIAIGIVDAFFLPNLPPTVTNTEEATPILAGPGKPSKELDNVESPISQREVFWQALKMPGIIDYSVHLFFVKLSVYIFYYWIPTWFVSVAIGGKAITYVYACYYTALWGAGGIVGTLLIGWCVYLQTLYGVYSSLYSLAAGVMILVLYSYSTYQSSVIAVFLLIVFTVGITQLAPYSLSSACMPSVINRIGRESAGGNTKLVGMATGIIDGVGSVGAISGPLFGAIILQYTTWGWGFVFLVVALAMFAAAVVLALQVNKEVYQVYRNINTLREL
eukprot:sb/3464586/